MLTKYGGEPIGLNSCDMRGMALIQFERALNEVKSRVNDV